MVKLLKLKGKKCYSSRSTVLRRLRGSSCSSKEGYIRVNHCLSSRNQQEENIVRNRNRNREHLLFGRTNSLFEKRDNKYINIFRNAGLYRFLKTEAGGKNNSKNALLTCKRLASYVIWILSKKGVGDKTSYENKNTREVIRTVLDLLIKKPQYIGEYMEYLTFRNATPSTKLSIMNHLKKCALWAMLSAPFDLSTELHCFEKICKNICRSCKRQNSLRIQNRGNLDYLKKKKRWPEGGYSELLNHVLRSCKFVDELAVNVANEVDIKKSDYCRLLRVLIALLYLTSHQGRPNAIKMLT